MTEMPEMDEKDSSSNVKVIKKVLEALRKLPGGEDKATSSIHSLVESTVLRVLSVAAEVGEVDISIVTMLDITSRLLASIKDTDSRDQAMDLFNERYRYWRKQVLEEVNNGG